MGNVYSRGMACLAGGLIFLGTTSSLLGRPYLKIQQVRSLANHEVLLEVSVAKIAPIANLKSESFSVSENGKSILSFHMPEQKNAQDPKHLVLLIDSSRSLSPRKFTLQKRAAMNFLKRLHANDKMAVYSFNDSPVLECDFTSDKNTIKEAIKSIRRNGKKTVLYDAILAAFRLTAVLKNARKSIIVYTDGKDTGSAVQLTDLLHKAEQENTPLFIAGTGNSARLKALARLARVSGGEAFRATRLENIRNVFQLLSELLDSTYFLSYKSSAIPGSKVEIEVKLKHRDGDGFFADSDLYSYEMPSTIPESSGTVDSNSPKKINISNVSASIQHERLLLYVGGLLVLLLLIIIIILLLRKNVVKVEVPANIVLPPATIMTEHDEKLAAKSDRYPLKKAENDKAKLPLEYYHAYLMEKEGPHTGRRYRINWHVVTMGSAEENSIVIHDPTVSLRHAQIEREKGQFVLYDLVSENGTFLNGKKLLRPRELNDFDEIQIGRTRLIFRKASA